MNIERLLQRIRLGKDSTLELQQVKLRASGKTTEPHADGLSDELAALGNAHGGLDHKSAKGGPAHVGLRAQDNVLRGSGDAGTEQGGRNYDQGPSEATARNGTITKPGTESQRCDLEDER